MGAPAMGAWGAAEDAALVRLRGEGRPASDIGAALGRSRSAVLGRLHRLGLLGAGAPEAASTARLRALAVEKRRETRAAAAEIAAEIVAATRRAGAVPSGAAARARETLAARRAALDAASPQRPTTMADGIGLSESPAPIAVVDLDAALAKCRWPAALDEDGVIALYCGRPAPEATRPWCPACARRAFAAPPPPKAKLKPSPRARRTAAELWA